ncbi:MAG: hypothetical protein LBG58_13295, partial [Planctomycetaceae bacterium]|nr:hypothetical protein [Planctomycetaceae bacterium]
MTEGVFYYVRSTCQQQFRYRTLLPYGSVCRFGAMFSTLPLGGAGQSFALKGQYIPARRIAAGVIT